MRLIPRLAALIVTAALSIQTAAAQSILRDAETEALLRDMAAPIVAAIAALAIEVARIVTRSRFPLSAVSIGLGVVLPPESTFAMFVGALIFWIRGRRYKAAGTPGPRFWVAGLEPICAGLISGAALMGIGNAIVNVLM